MCHLIPIAGVQFSCVFKPLAFSIILSIIFAALEISLSCQVMLNFANTDIPKAILLLISASDFPL